MERTLKLKTTNLKSSFRARAMLLAGAVTALPLSVFLMVQPAQAADVLGEKVGKNLQTAQTALAAHKYAEAMAAVNAADAVSGKTDYESYTIEQMRGAVAASSGNVAVAISAYDKVIASPRTPAAMKEQLALSEAGMAYGAKDYARAAQIADKYVKAGGANPQMYTILIQSYYLGKDYANAARAQQAQIDMQAKAGTKPTENQLQLLAACQTQTHDQAALTKTYVALATYYPKPDYWAQVVHSALSNPHMAGALRLDADRVRLAAGLVKTPAEYIDIAELAMQAGLPQIALDVMNEGYSANVLGHDAGAAREDRLKQMITQTVADRKANIATAETQAQQAPNGNALVTTGYNYVTFGQADKGLQLMNAGIAKGTTDVNIARLHLGLAQAAAGQKAAAITTLKSVGGDNGAQDIAQFWVLKLGAPS